MAKFAKSSSDINMVITKFSKPIDLLFHRDKISNSCYGAHQVPQYQPAQKENFNVQNLPRKFWLNGFSFLVRVSYHRALHNLSRWDITSLYQSLWRLSQVTLFSIYMRFDLCDTPLLIFFKHMRCSKHHYLLLTAHILLPYHTHTFAKLADLIDIFNNNHHICLWQIRSSAYNSHFLLSVLFSKDSISIYVIDMRGTVAGSMHTLILSG